MEGLVTKSKKIKNNPPWSEKEINYLKEISKKPLDLVSVVNKINGKFWQGRIVRTTASLTNICYRYGIKRNGVAGTPPWVPSKEIKNEIKKLISEGKNKTYISKIVAPKTGLKPKTLVPYIGEIGEGEFFNPCITSKRKLTAMELERILGQRNSGISCMALANQYGLGLSAMKSTVAHWKTTRSNI